MSGASTVQDVLDLINASGVNVTAQVNSAGTALEISSTVAGSVPVVTDEDASESASALGLQSGGDIIGILKDFQQALINDDVEAISNVLLNLQAAFEGVKEVAATNASRSTNVEEMESFADNLTLQNTKPPFRCGRSGQDRSDRQAVAAANPHSKRSWRRHPRS